MWVYAQEPLETEKTTAPAEFLPVAVPSTETVHPTIEPLPPEPETVSVPQTQLPKSKPRSTRDCCLLAAAYLLGTIAAGWLQAVCDTRQLELLNYYLTSWRGLFAVSSVQAAAGLFFAEYVSLGTITTILLLFGLSALGPALVFFLMMLYGLGSGLLAASLFANLQWSTVLRFLFLSGIPAACATGCLCTFGALALQVSARIRAYSFWHRSGQAFPAASVFVGQYALTLVILLPLCGAATGLSYLSTIL